MKKAKKSNRKGMQESLDFIVEHMATKDDVREIIKTDVPPIVRKIVKEEIATLVPSIVALELKPIREQLKEILDRLDTLDDQYTNLKGITKEIDEFAPRSSCYPKTPRPQAARTCRRVIIFPNDVNPIKFDRLRVHSHEGTGFRL
jgi:hypothetical protein